MTKKSTFMMVCALFAIAGLAHAQTGTTTLSVTVGPEAALTVTTGTTTLSTTSTTFGNPFTGTTNLTYEIRTSKTSGTGSLTLKITADFGGTGGPSVATPPSTGDALSYTCTVSTPGTACTGSQTASTTASTPFGTWGAAANSTKAGNSASVAWSLTDDPVYAQGTYTATATFTISAT
jgi:peptidoglycan DL-endopeptidase CwlO